jgi:hypothetical protein
MIKVYLKIYNCPIIWYGGSTIFSNIKTERENEARKSKKKLRYLRSLSGYASHAINNVENNFLSHVKNAVIVL